MLFKLKSGHVRSNCALFHAVFVFQALNYTCHKCKSCLGNLRIDLTNLYGHVVRCRFYSVQNISLMTINICPTCRVFWTFFVVGTYGLNGSPKSRK